MVDGLVLATLGGLAVLFLPVVKTQILVLAPVDRRIRLRGRGERGVLEAQERILELVLTTRFPMFWSRWRRLTVDNQYRDRPRRLEARGDRRRTRV